MSSASDYLENNLLNGIMGSAAFITPAQRYLALFNNTTTAKLEAGSIVDEVSGANYSRIALNPTLMLSTSTVGQIVNTTNILSPVASGNWGTITHIAVMSNGTPGAGTVYLHCQVNNPREITAGKWVQIDAGVLQILAD